MRGSGRGGGVGDPRNVSHPLCRFRVRRVKSYAESVYKEINTELSTSALPSKVSEKKSHLSSFVSLLLSTYKLDIDIPKHPKKKMLEKLELQNQGGQNNPQIL